MVNSNSHLDKFKTYDHKTKNFMGLNSNKTQIIGILNMTPDSFASNNKKILKRTEINLLPF